MIDYTLAAKLACKKIICQFKNTPEEMFFYAIIEQAIRDYSKGLQSKASPLEIVNSGTAKYYLANDIIHAEMCDVDSEWIRIVLKKCGLDVEVYND